MVPHHALSQFLYVLCYLDWSSNNLQLGIGIGTFVMSKTSQMGGNRLFICILMDWNLKQFFSTFHKQTVRQHGQHHTFMSDKKLIMYKWRKYFKYPFFCSWPLKACMEIPPGSQELSTSSVTSWTGRKSAKESNTMRIVNNSFSVWERCTSLKLPWHSLVWKGEMTSLQRKCFC